MRAYVPMTGAELAEFCTSLRAVVSEICLPTESLANEYGVSDLEDLEYGALEVARTIAEQTNKTAIVALELDHKAIGASNEKDPGVVMGDFTIGISDVVAFYVITASDEELEWYDASEAALCLSKVAE